MKDTTRSVTIASLGIFAVAVAASTLDSTLLDERDGPRGRGGDGVGVSSPPESRSPPREVIEIPFLVELLIALTSVAALVFVVYALRNWRETARQLLAVVVLFGLLCVLFSVVPLSMPTELPGTDPGNASATDGGGGERGTDSAPAPVPTLLVLVGLGVVGLAAVVALARQTAGNRDTTTQGAGDRDTPTAAVGRAAGRAADRLDAQSDVDNEVYRTWQEMTELLDVDEPARQTPGEFATAAVDAGLRRTDVRELTQLFEAVRYGRQDPSQEYERRAVTVFRRIEDQYSEDES